MIVWWLLIPSTLVTGAIALWLGIDIGVRIGMRICEDAVRKAKDEQTAGRRA